MEAAALSSSSYSSTALLKSSVRVAPCHVRFPKRLRPMGPRAVAALRSVEQPQQRSFYELLGIDENVGLSDIKQAYRQMARKYHPDVCPRERAEEYTRRFMEVQEAYETLSDPRRKSLYDTHLSRGIGSGASVNMRWDYPKEELVKEEWRSRWDVQLNNLKQRNCKNADQPLSWGARMRQQNSAT